MPQKKSDMKVGSTKPVGNHVPPLWAASRPPEALAVDAVERLESAIAVLGEANLHVRPLKDALEAAKSRSKVPPVAERVEACKKFLERAKRRSSPPPELVGADCRVDQGTGFSATFSQHRSPQGSAGRMVLKRHSRSTICPYELGRGG